MWTCPRCKQKFYNKNQSHSCGHYSLADFLKGKTEQAVELFHHFLKEYKEIGKFELHPVRTRVALLTKMRFASVNKIGKNHISIHFVLTKRYHDNLCFYKIENLADRFFVHHLKMVKKSDINEEVKKYMKLAYQVGNRVHVEERKNEKAKNKS